MGLYNKTLSYQYLYPNKNLVWDKGQDILVKSSTTADGLQINGTKFYTMKLTDNSIYIDFQGSAVWTNEYTPPKAPSSLVKFNGPVFQDLEKSIAGFSSIKLQTNIAGITKSDIIFSGDQIAINFSGIHTSDQSFIKLSITFDKPIEGGRGNDTLTGTDAEDILKGHDGNDILRGGKGNDDIIGGAGWDDLYGGPGKDTFIFYSVAEIGNVTNKKDSIYDFTHEDVIDLSDIDANTKVSGAQDFNFVGTKAFSGKAGELRYEKKASDTYVYGDVNGDKKADFILHLHGAIKLSADDFLL